MAWLHPEYLWALLALPLVIALFLWAAYKRRQARLSFGEAPVVTKLSAAVSARRRRWKASLITAGVLLLAVALAGPRMGTRLREVKREGIDLVIALDVSLSMEAQDVAPNRLSRAKNEIKKLLDQLSGDRVALVIFAGDAFIQCPLTTDYGAVRLFLDVAEPSLIPTPGTDFSEALRMALQAMEVSEEEKSAPASRTRAILFVSDGENHVADVESILREARSANVMLFAAGIGETDGVPIPVYENGRQTGYKKDNSGRIVATRLEEDALKTLAEGGAYFRVARTSSSLSELTAALSRLERSEYGSEEFEEYEEQFQWPLALAILLLTAEMLFSDRRKTSGASILS